MELTGLKQFIVAAETQNFTEAAKLLFVSQPSLSRTISALESELNTRLFDRAGKSVTLNNNGRIVYKYAKRVFQNLEEMSDEMRQSASGEPMTMKVGIVSFVGGTPSWLDASLKWFMQEYQNIELSLVSLDAMNFAASMFLSNADLAVSFLVLEEHDSVTRIPLGSDNVGITVSKNHRLAGKDVLYLADLKNENFLLCDNNAELTRLTLEMCAYARFQPNVLCSIESPGLISQMVGEGKGISIISRAAFQSNMGKLDSHANMIFKPLADEVCRRTSFAYIPKGRRIPAHVSALVERMRQSSAT